MIRDGGLPSVARTLEQEILLNCALRRPTATQLANLRALVRENVDWSSLFELASEHGLLPLLYRHLQDNVATSVPQPVLEDLRVAFTRNAAHMMQLTRELLDIVRDFETEGIPLLPYKGPALAQQIYDNIALRQAGDLDIVVRRDDVGRARQLLIARGYRPRFALSPEEEAAQRAYLYHEQFLGSEADPRVVELHWRFARHDLTGDFDLDELLPRLARIPMGGGSVLASHPEDLLLLLCVHGSKHGWTRLEWATSIAELIVREADFDWDSAVERAASYGCRRILLLGVYVAHKVLGAPIPERIKTMLQAVHGVPRLARESERRIFDAGKDGPADRRTDSELSIREYRERLPDGLLRRLRYMWYTWTVPDHVEQWYYVRILGRLLPLHVVLHPLRVATSRCTKWYRRMRAVHFPQGGLRRLPSDQPVGEQT